MRARSVMQSEVIETVRSPETLRLGRRGAVRATKTFPFNSQHGGTFYQFKKVEVRYIEESAEFVILTVISKFFN